MTVFLTSAETDDEVTLQWHCTAVGDFVENGAGIQTLHPTLFTRGSITLSVSGVRDEDFDPPQIIILPSGVGYKFTALTAPGTIYCFYSKATGAADEIMHLVSTGTVVWNQG